MKNEIEEATRIYALMQEQVFTQIAPDTDNILWDTRHAQHLPSKVITVPNVEAQIKVLADYIREVREKAKATD